MENKKPYIYSAIYSGVPVYETIIDDIPIMRRMSDNYMNATQLLKIAGFPKPKRTKILEKEILTGKHEKIQGGYGKYQGTWIPLSVSKDLAYRYGIGDILSAIMNFDPEKDELGTKPQSSKAAAKVVVEVDDEDKDPHSILRRTPSRSRQTSAANSSPILRNHIQQQEPTPQYADSPKKHGDRSNKYLNRRLFAEEEFQTEFFHSVLARRHAVNSDEPIVPTIENIESPNLNSVITDDEELRRRSILMGIFINTQLSTLTIFENLRNPQDKEKFDVDMILDDRSSTPLHWAAACARIDVIEGLLAVGASASKASYGGETPLMRALYSPRNFFERTFDQILRKLESSMFIPDCQGRTILHHVAYISQVPRKRKMASYYLRCIADYVYDYRETTIPFAGFLDYVDLNGDTALNLAVKFKFYRMVDILLHLGAQAVTVNKNGENCWTFHPKDSRLEKIIVAHEQNRINKTPSALVDDFEDPLTSSDDSDPTHTPPETEGVKQQSLSFQAGESQQSIAVNEIGPAHHLSSDIYLASQDLAIARTRVKKGVERFNKIEEVVKKSNPYDFQPSDIRKRTSPNLNSFEKRFKYDIDDDEESRLLNQVAELEQTLKDGQVEHQRIVDEFNSLDDERKIKDRKYVQKVANAMQIPEESVEDIIQACKE